LESFYSSENGTTNALNVLIENGLMSINQIAEFTKSASDKSMSRVGQDFFENVLVGAVLRKDAIDAINNIPFIRQTVVKAIHPLMENKGFSPDYNLISELSDAVIVLAEAYKSGVITHGENAEKIFMQGKLYEDNIYDETVQILAHFLNDNKPTELKKIISLHNSEAMFANAGQADLEIGRVRTKKEILKNILEREEYAIRIIRRGEENNQSYQTEL